MTVSHKEIAFEAAIEHSLLTDGGYRVGNPAEFNATLGLTPSLIVEFLRDSQPKEWARLEVVHAAAAPTKVVALIAKELDNRGTLDVLRHGVVDHGVKLRLAYYCQFARKSVPLFALKVSPLSAGVCSRPAA
jgi:type I restriction enzyme R subunit